MKEMAEAASFAVEVLTLVGLLRYYVLFVIHIQTRRVHMAGVAGYFPLRKGCHR